MAGAQAGVNISKCDRRASHATLQLHSIPQSDKDRCEYFELRPSPPRPHRDAHANTSKCDTTSPCSRHRTLHRSAHAKSSTFDTILFRCRCEVSSRTLPVCDLSRPSLLRGHPRLLIEPYRILSSVAPYRWSAVPFRILRKVAILL